MIKYIYTGLFLSICLLISCKDENTLFNQDGEVERTHNLPISVNTSFDSDYLTRGDVANAKTFFDNDDLIHIDASFKCKGKDDLVKAYGAMQYQNGVWSAYTVDLNGEVVNEVLYWPDDAEWGEFKAYYIHGSNGLLTENDMEPIRFSSLYDGIDPLYAVSPQRIQYGHTIELVFRHLLAHLTIIQLEAGVSDYFWITKDDSDSPSGFNNAFKLIYDPESKTIREHFYAIKNTAQGKVYVSGSNQIYEDEETLQYKGKVEFFLQPGIYDTFLLLYPVTTETSNTYLRYKNSNDKKPQMLESNGRYILDVVKSAGFIEDTPPENKWDEETPPYALLDVEAFLRAVANGTSYKENGLEILEERQDGGTNLLLNIDFQFQNKEIYESDNFQPNVSSTFDGQYHYIFNLGNPLFNSNSRTIRNLGINTVGSYNQEGKPWLSTENYGQLNIDLSRHGAIVNQNNGDIQNIRIKNVDITVAIQTTDPDEPDQETHFVSALVAENKGMLRDVDMSGNFNVKVQNNEGCVVMPAVNLGGLTAANSGTINEIKPLEGGNSPVVSIANLCSGVSATYSVGGVTGNNTGKIYNIMLPKIEIDCSKSKGMQAVYGGIAGGVRNSDPAPEIESCVINGTLKAGVTDPYGSATCYSYTGSIAGYLSIKAKIANCSLSFSLEGGKTEDPESRVIFATGGAFGRIQAEAGVSEGSIDRIGVIGTALSGSGFLGDFAGVIPENKNENDFKSTRINVKDFDEIPYVGASM
ncbi:MAG: hypothetical protein J1F67_11355 [Muribaculaceae bacterium]|nr:hypothetical protein [Muribaculaceae bacterium]